MGTTAAIIDSTLITDRGSRDKLGREMDDALLRYRSRFCRSAFRYLGNAATRRMQSRMHCCPLTST